MTLKLILAGLTLIILSAVIVTTFMHGLDREISRMEEENRRISQQHECDIANIQGWPLDCEDFRG